MVFKVILHEEDGGGFWAEVPALPGCYSQGDTVKELKRNIAEAIQGYLETVEQELVNKRSKRTRVEEVTV